MTLNLPLKAIGSTLFSLFMLSLVHGQQIPFELDPDSNTTFTYQELTSYYTDLLEGRDDARLVDVGRTDVGKPLHLIVISKDGVFDPQQIKASGKAVLLINNGIHPGEPAGIDASMMFLRDLLESEHLPDNLVLCIIPVYNIAGM
ncbi:MAG: M14 family zinc carboxypeptidase, partial [Sphingobacteriaceae bacterium]